MSEQTSNAQARIADLPDDCILIFTKWLTVVDIVCLRMTCKRMEYATHLRSLWYPIYHKFSRLVPMLPLPYPYSIDSLDTVPAHILESLSIFAYRLHLHFIQPIPSPWSVASLRRNPTRSTTASTSDELHILPGGRWLVEVSSESWKASIWDLTSSEKYEVAHTSLLNQGVVHPSTSAVVVLGDHLHVLLHGVQSETSPLSFRTISHVLTLRLPVKSCQNAASTIDNSLSRSPQQTIRRLPSLPGLSGPTTPVDANGPLMSFYVKEEEELYVIDWTHDEKAAAVDANTSEVRVKGVVLCSFLLGELLPTGSTWTRVIPTKHHNYLLFVTSDGSVFLFLIPSLTVAHPERLPRVQVAPIARLTVPSIPIESISAWSAEIPADDAKGSIYTLSLSTPMSVYTITLLPSRTSQAHNYDDMSTMSPSTLTLVRTHLPITLDKRVSLCTLGPSGTRGVYVERSRYMSGFNELVLYAGPLPDVSRFTGSHSAVYLGDAYLEGEASTELPNPTVSRRVVLPGVSSGIKQNIDQIAFDECSGRVCFRRADGTISIMDFAPVKIGLL